MTIQPITPFTEDQKMFLIRILDNAIHSLEEYNNVKSSTELLQKQKFGGKNISVALQYLNENKIIKAYRIISALADAVYMLWQNSEDKKWRWQTLIMPIYKKVKEGLNVGVLLL